MSRKLFYRRMRAGQVIGYQVPNELYDNDRMLGEGLSALESSAVTHEELDDRIGEIDLVPGPSAYEVAVENGFQGTEQQWLASLKGADGKTPYIGPNDNWWIGDHDTQISAKGIKGDPGSRWHTGANPPSTALGDVGDFYLQSSGTYYEKTGPSTWTERGTLRGQKGDDGTSPHIGGNGNWWIGTQDTGVKAQGPQGPEGPPGPVHMIAAHYTHLGGGEYQRLHGDPDFDVAAHPDGQAVKITWFTPRVGAVVLALPGVGAGGGPVVGRRSNADPVSVTLSYVDLEGSPDWPVTIDVIVVGAPQ